MGFYPAPPRIGATGHKGIQKSNRLYLKNCYTFECKKRTANFAISSPYTKYNVNLYLYEILSSYSILCLSTL